MILILERTIIFAVATVIYICGYFVLEIKKSSHNDKYPIPTSLRNKIILTIIEPKLRQACLGAAGQKAWTWPGRSNCSPKGQLYPLPFRTRFWRSGMLRPGGSSLASILTIASPWATACHCEDGLHHSTKAPFYDAHFCSQMEDLSGKKYSYCWRPEQ